MFMSERKREMKNRRGALRPRLRVKKMKKRKQPALGLDSKLVSAPVAKSRLQRTRRPKITSLRNGDSRIVHREYVADILAGAGAPSAFNVDAFPVNPGQPLTFQWLSRVASNYESYRFDSLRFDFETEASTQLGGTLLLSLDYDAQDPAPITKQQAMAYRSSVRSSPWASCQHTSVAEDLHKNKSNFIRLGAQPPGTDIKTYDIGNLFVITQGVSVAGAACGELYVEYDVTLMTPVYENGATLVPVGGFIDGSNTQTPANPLGVAPMLDPQAYGIQVDGASRISFLYIGNYLFSADIAGTVLISDLLTPGSPRIVVNNLVSVVNAGATEMSTAWSIAVSAPGFVDYTVVGTTITPNSADIRLATAPFGSLG